MLAKQADGAILVRWVRPARNQRAGHEEWFDARYATAIERWVADGWAEVLAVTPEVVPVTTEIAEPVKHRAVRKRRKKKVSAKG